MTPRTLPALFKNSVQKFGSNTLLWEKKGAKYKGLSYSEAEKQVYNFSAGLISLGLNKGDRAALISEGRNDWALSELGILFAGAVNVPISIKINDLADLKFRIDPGVLREPISPSRPSVHLKALTSYPTLPCLSRVSNFPQDYTTDSL